jgi:hypothetical protein
MHGGLWYAYPETGSQNGNPGLETLFWRIWNEES